MIAALTMMQINVVFDRSAPKAQVFPSDGDEATIP